MTLERLIGVEMTTEGEGRKKKQTNTHTYLVREDGVRLNKLLGVPFHGKVMKQGK